MTRPKLLALWLLSIACHVNADPILLQSPNGCIGRKQDGDHELFLKVCDPTDENVLWERGTVQFRSVTDASECIHVGGDELEGPEFLARGARVYKQPCADLGSPREPFQAFDPAWMEGPLTLMDRPDLCVVHFGANPSVGETRIMMVPCAELGGDRALGWAEVVVGPPTDFPTKSPTTPEPTIVDLAVATEELSTLVDLVVLAELAETLAGEGPFTVFAPTNAAFAELDPELVAALVDDPSGALTNVLLYHVVPGTVLLADLEYYGPMVATAAGPSVEVSLSDDGAMINNANIVAADIIASNGVVHVIDKVLIPPPPTASPTATPTKAPTETPSSSPTSSPSEAPTVAPSSSPTGSPSEAPTKSPTAAPTSSPSEAPTAAPTAAPTEAPSYSPTSSPAPTGFDYFSLDSLPGGQRGGCIGRNNDGSDELLYKTCRSDDDSVQWRIDNEGRLRSKVDDSECMQAEERPELLEGVQALVRGTRMYVKTCADPDSLKEDFQLLDESWFNNGLMGPLKLKFRPDLCIVHFGADPVVMESRIMLIGCDELAEGSSRSEGWEATDPCASPPLCSIRNFNETEGNEPLIDVATSKNGFF